jgi:hypothetical protein
MMSDTTASAAGEPAVTDETAAKRPPVKIGWLSIGIAIVFGLFYAYDLFEAVSNVVGLTAQIADDNKVREAVDLAPHAVPWALLVADLLVAPVVFVVAFLLGRRRNVLQRAVLLAVGLAAVSAISLSLVALA